MSFQKGHIFYKGGEKGWFKKGQKPWNTGMPMTEEVKQKLHKALVGRKLSKDTIERIRIASTGRRHTEEAKLKVGKSKMFDKNYNWKGDKVSYSALHKWVYKVLGKAKRCSNCDKEGSYIEWANISGKYKRDTNDWEQLCRKCHMIKDGRLMSLKKYGYQVGWSKQL